MDARGRGRTRAATLALTLAVLGALSLPALAAKGDAKPRLIATIDSRGPNETRSTIPVTRSPGAEPFVVLSERLKAGGGLMRGDILRATAEVQLSTTCAKPEPRCIGSRYTYSPRMAGQVVLASSPTATGGSSADPISGVKEKHCTQQRPNRNHHCVLVFSEAVKRVRNAGNLPCPPADCFLNVVASADHPNAGSGDVVIVGADRPDATVDGDKARVDGLIERGEIPPPRIQNGGAKMRDSVLIEPSGGTAARSSARSASTGSRGATRCGSRPSRGSASASVPYNVYIGTRVIIATSPTETRTNGFVADVISSGGEITEQNGFNCTQGASEYKDPCNSPKAATAYVKRKMPEKNGEPKPVFVNIVMAGLPKLTTSSRPNDRMKVMDGAIRTERYRVP